MLLGSRLQVRAAASYSVANGDITITMDVNGAYSVKQGDNGAETVTEPITITGTSTRLENKNETKGSVVKIDVAAGQEAKVILSGVTIDASKTGNVSDDDPNAIGDAALYTCGEGSVKITLLGANTLISGALRAGLEKENTGTLTITGANKQSDKLTATGGDNGAGIGTGCYTGSSDAKDITISGGYITATGEKGGGAGIGSGARRHASNILIEGSQTEVHASATYGAAIGGGGDGNGSQITISGGTVTARSELGAGIGSGTINARPWVAGTDITISGGTVTASSKKGAGIGGGYGGSGQKITISDGIVMASSKEGAGIGGGFGEAGSQITIRGGAVKATSEEGGAGIGGGSRGDGIDITISGGIVLASSELYGAGIGGGCSSYENESDFNKITKAENITISGDACVQATGGRAHVNFPDKIAPAIGGGLEKKGNTVSNPEDYGKPFTPNTSGLNTTTGGLRMQVRNKDGAIIASQTKTIGTVPANLEERFRGSGSSGSNGGSADAKDQPRRSVFERTLGVYEHSIKSAKAGDTVTITGDERFNALPNNIMKELVKNKNISLKFTYLYQGKKYTILIPAGGAEDNDIPWYGPMYLWGKYGVKVE